MAKGKIKHLPSVLYIRRETDDDGDSWFIAREYSEEIAERGETIVAGVYQLVKLCEVSLNASIKELEKANG